MVPTIHNLHSYLSWYLPSITYILTNCGTYHPYPTNMVILYFTSSASIRVRRRQTPSEVVRAGQERRRRPGRSGGRRRGGGR